MDEMAIQANPEPRKGNGVINGVSFLGLVGGGYPTLGIWGPVCAEIQGGLWAVCIENAYNR